MNPSINTLKSLAAALQVPLFKFFQDENKEEKVIVRKGKYKIIGRPEEEVVYQLLTPDVSGMIEFCSMTVPPGQVSSEREMEHVGEEVAYVMTGAVRIYMEGKEYELGEGDCVRIPPQCRTAGRTMKKKRQRLFLQLRRHHSDRQKCLIIFNKINLQLTNEMLY